MKRQRPISTSLVAGLFSIFLSLPVQAKWTNAPDCPTPLEIDHCE